MTDVEAVRTQMHALWASIADNWAEHADYADERASAITAALLHAADLQPGDRVLELACGAGGLGIAAAQRVGARGEVVVSDVVPRLVEVATERAARSGATNVLGAVRDLERIDDAGASYDVVLCREGLMFAADPARAVREIARVLRPGGRVAAAVWGPRERNPWLALVLDSVSHELGVPIPPPGLPGPFALGDAGTVEALLHDAGLLGVEVHEQPAPLHEGSFDEWWARTTALAGPVSRIIAAQPPEVAAAIVERARAAAAPFADGDGLAFPGVTLIARARVAR